MVWEREKVRGMRVRGKKVSCRITGGGEGEPPHWEGGT